MVPKRIKCPTCGRDVAWESAPFRPFCSERCRLIDLGAWLSEQRSVPGESVAVHAIDAPDDGAEGKSQP